MQFVKHITCSLFLLGGLLAVWPGGSLYAQEGEGVRLLSVDPNTENLIMLQATGINAEFGEFATFGVNADNRLLVSVEDGSEVINIGLSRRANADGRFTPSGDYYFLIRDVSDNSIVHGPFLIDDAVQNVSDWSTASYGAYQGSARTTATHPVYNFRGNTREPTVGTDTGTPFLFAPGSAGTYSIEFRAFGSFGQVVNLFLPYWNFTVTDQLGIVQTGRLWSRNWALRTPPTFPQSPETLCAWNRPFRGDFYSYTADGVITQVDFAESGMAGLSFNVAFNSTGPGTSGDLVMDRMSQDSTNATPNAAEHQIFLSLPDADIFPPTDECGEFSVGDASGLRCADGEFCLPITLSESAQVEVRWIRGEGDEIPIAIVDYPQDSVPEGGLSTCIPFNLLNLNEIGGEVDELELTVTFSRGLQHWAAYDVEKMDNGFCVSTIAPSCTTPPSGSDNVTIIPGDDRIFWDDRNIAAEPGGGGTKLGLVGDLCGAAGARRWTNFNLELDPGQDCGDVVDEETTGYGDKATINTWWYPYRIVFDNITLPIPTLRIDGPELACIGTTITYTAVYEDGTAPGGLSYSWSYQQDSTSTAAALPDLTAAINPALGGIYCVTVTESDGCGRSTCKSLELVDGEEVIQVMTDSPVTVCPGDTVMLTATTTAGPEVTYEWTPANAFVPGTTTSAMPLYLAASGVSQVTVTARLDEFCAGTGTVDIIISDPITLDAVVAFDDVCTPVDTLRATVTGPATVEWLDADGNIVGSGLEYITSTGTGDTEFTARATSTDCADDVLEQTLTVRYNPVEISVPSPTVEACSNEDVMLSVTNEDPDDILTYEWTPAEFFADNTLAQPDYLEEFGSQTVTVTAVNQDSCEASLTVVITVLPPITLDAEVAFDDACTPVDTLRATVTGPATVEWLDASGNVVGTGLEYITSTGTGNTEFTARATNTDCPDDVREQILTVRYNPVEISVPSPVVDVCPGQPVVLSVINEDPENDVLTYEWTPAEFFVDNTLAQPDYLEEFGPQTVTVTATNQDSCVASEMVEIIIQQPIILEVEVAFDDECTPVDTLRANLLQGSAVIEWLNEAGSVVGFGPEYVTNTGEGESIFRARATSTNPDCEEIIFSDTLSVRYEPVNISLSADNETTVCANEQVILGVVNEDPADILDSISWTPAGAFADNTVANPDYDESQGSQTVQVKATNQFGCMDSIPVDIIIQDTISLTLAVDNDPCVDVATLTATVTGSTEVDIDWLNEAGDSIATGPTYMPTLPEGATVVTVRARNLACAGDVKTETDTLRYEPVDISLSEDNETTVCANEQVILGVVNNDPSDMLTYTWTPADAFADNTVANPDYDESQGSQRVQVKATNQFMCMDSIPVDIIVQDTISLTLEVDNDPCVDVATLTATVTGSTEVDIDWLNEAGDSIATGPTYMPTLPEGATVVTVRARNLACAGDVKTETDTLRYEPVDISLSEDNETTVCANEQVILGVVNNDPSDMLTYTWTPADAFADNTVTNPDYDESQGSQTVQVKATNQFGCMDSIPVDIIIQDTISLTLEVDNDPCVDVATLTATVTGSTEVDIDWLNEAGDSIATGPTYMPTLPEGATVVTVRARNLACAGDVKTETDTLRYEPVDISLSEDNETTVCANEQVILGVVNNDPSDMLTYTWTPADAFADNTVANPDYDESQGSQTVQVKATNQFGCMDSIPVDIIIQDTISLTLAVDNDPCVDVATLTATVTGSTEVDIDWLNEAGDSIATGPTYMPTLPEGATVVTVRARNLACAGDVKTETDTLRYEPVDISLSEDNETTVCANEQVILGVVNNDPSDMLTYTWTPADAFADNTVANPDYDESQGSQTVQVKATNQFGCMDSIPVDIIIQDTISLTLAVDNDPCVDVATLTATVTGSTEVDIDWLNEAGDSIATGPTYMPTLPEGATVVTVRARNLACAGDVKTETDTLRYEPVDISLSEDNETTVCANEQVILGVVNNDPSDMLTYTWTPADAFADNTVANPDYDESQGSQTVQVKATNQFGCMDSIPVDIIIQDTISLTLAVDNDPCVDVATLTATVTGSTEVDIDWLNEAGDSIATGPTYMPTLPEGATVVTVRARNLACAGDVKTETDTLRYEPVNISVPSLAVAFCPGEQVSLSVTNEDPENDVLTYEWTPADAFVDNTLAEPDYLEELGGQSVTVTATNQFDCVDSRMVEIILSNLDVTINSPTVCETEPETSLIVVNNNPDDVLTYSWEPLGVTSPLDQASVSVDASITTAFQVTVTNEAGCQEVLMTTVNVVDFPDLSIVADPTEVEIPGTSTLTVSGCDSCDYVWDPPAPDVNNPVVEVPIEQEGDNTFTVTVITEEPCPNPELSITVVGFPPPNNPCVPDAVYLPNFFTPNGDDSNDRLRLRSLFLEDLLEVELMIYDRWGEEVFRTTDKFAEWDGTFKGEALAPDVYGFWLRVLCPDEEELIQKGNITLLR